MIYNSESQYKQSAHLGKPNIQAVSYGLAPSIILFNMSEKQTENQLAISYAMFGLCYRGEDG